MGDEDILQSKRFNTQLLDIFEGFAPTQGTAVGAMGQLVSIALGTFFPGVGVYRAYKHCFPNECILPFVYGLTTQTLLLVFIIFHGVEEANDLSAYIANPNWRTYAKSFPGKGLHTFAWVAYWGFTFINAYIRGELRRKYKVWGNYIEDFWSCLVFYPFCIAQMHNQAATEGKDSPAYFASVDDVIQLMADNAGDTAAVPGTLQQVKNVDKPMAADVSAA